ncbi:hypothetical protein ZWY2020_019114 [Hordeum vulgare]|nr:hypothetical protein ZWY2020_019114 [Hordeum vulgare]
MSMKLAIHVLLLPIVLAEILHPAVVVAVGGHGGGGFSLRLVPSPGWNRMMHVDNDGFVHLNLNEQAVTALRPPMHTQVGGMYSVVTSVGTGAGRRTYVLALDMTSHLLWMQCNPLQRRHFIQHPPPFDPANSPSFRPVPGNSPLCLRAEHRPRAHDSCNFRLRPTRYGAIEVSGVLGNETLAFTATSGEVAEVAGVVIGCAHDSYWFNSHDVLAGALGLGRQEPSLIWTLGQHRHGAVQVHRFSYCLPSPRRGSPDHHTFLRFGNDVPGTQHMVSTQIMYMSYTSGQDYSGYFVNLVGVSVAGRPLHHIGELFKRHMYPSGWTGGVVFDVGTPTMVMINTAYQKLNDAVVEHVRAALGVAPVRHPGYRLCFRATPHLWGHLPTVTLKFAEENARLVLTPQRLFVAAGRDICLDVQPSLDFTIIGAMQQVDTRFVYDVSAGRIYFAPENACHADAGGHI